MPIIPLPPHAIRAIGSSQALSDPASVIKELIDNAIDGRATNISVEVSANTLDDIRVKDNGHGITPDDRAMVCTRYCTSKIRDLHDLETIGGRSLGFRGEALASVAEMSKNLIITTRIEGEATAVELKFDHKGNVPGEKRASHPVGTTVRVEKYLQNMPVRRQAAEKISTKMLAKIKRMLEAYALARPHLRLSLKILKAKDRKGDWTYPKSGALSASRLEASFNAATDIFGKKLTSQCELVVSTWSSIGEQIDEAMSEKMGHSTSREKVYTFEATMAKKDCDGSVLSNVGQFLSVDSRPVSCTRGTLKQIISSYKSHLRSTIASGDVASIVDPFLCLNIACPLGSYDANVEPAKDDVLFTDSELILGIVERWFHSVYGELQPNPSKPSEKTASTLKPHGIEMLLARTVAPVKSAPLALPAVAGSTLPVPRSEHRVTPHIQLSPSHMATSALVSSATVPPNRDGDNILRAFSNSTTEPPATGDIQPEAHLGLLPSHDCSALKSSEKPSLEPSSDAVPVEEMPGWRGSMYAQDEDEEQDLGMHLQGWIRSPVDVDLDGDGQVPDVKASNPWVFAKLNAAMRPSGRNKQLHTPGRQNDDVGNSTDPSSNDLQQHLDPPSVGEPSRRVHLARSSPEAAYPTPSPFPFPQKASGRRKANDASVDASLTPVPSNKERHQRGLLDTWAQKSLGGYDELDNSPNTLQADRGPPDLPHSFDFISARSLPQGGTPLSEIPDAPQRPRRKPAPQKQQQGNIDKPFVSPVNDPHRVWFDTGDKPSQKRPQKPRPNHGHQNTAAAASALILRDDEIEDYESSAEQSLTPLHPDLAITLDYEARKQKASEAHKRVLREQAAAAKLAAKTQPDAPAPLHPQHTTTSSPHKYRQAKAIAALHTSDIPPPTAPSLAVRDVPATALEPSDPRAYLLRMHQQGKQAPGKSRRQKTASLPLETLKEDDYIGDLTLIIEDVNVGDVNEDLKESGAWDFYVKNGAMGGAFEDVGAENVTTWEEKLKELVRELYAVEDEDAEEKRASMDLDVDLSKTLQAHVAGSA